MCPSPSDSHGDVRTRPYSEEGILAKVNCWEFKKCGREPGGAKVDQLGVCAAAAETRTDGVNGGKNGGRVCWAVTGTLCGGKVQGTFARKLANCLLDCTFFKETMKEERKNLELYPSVKRQAPASVVG